METGTFAMLWLYVNYVISIIEYEKNDRKFTGTKAPSVSTLHFTSINKLSDSRKVPSLFLSFAFVHICFLSYHYFKKEKKSVLKLIGPYIFLLGIGSALKGLYTFSQIIAHNNVIEKLKKSGFEMFNDSPLFGWGINSFQKLAPYYNDASLLNQNYEAIPSSFINFLCEFGIIGTVIISLLPIILYIRYLKYKQNNSFSNILFFALFLIVLLVFRQPILQYTCSF